MLRVVINEIMNLQRIKMVTELDKLVYDEIYCATVEQYIERIEKNPKSFIVAYAGNKLVGYINLFPVTDGMYNTIRSGNLETDIFMNKNQVEVYREGHHHKIYVMSTVVSPKYQGTHVAAELSNAFDKYIIDLQSNGIIIDNIIAMAISEQGIRYWRKSGLTTKHKVGHNTILELH